MTESQSYRCSSCSRILRLAAALFFVAALTQLLAEESVPSQANARLKAFHDSSSIQKGGNTISQPIATI